MKEVDQILVGRTQALGLVAGGAQAALVSGRTSQGSGLGIDVDGVLEPGVQYELTAWATTRRLL